MQNRYVRPVSDTREVTSPDDLGARLRGRILPLAPLELPLADARGCVLHSFVFAPDDVPSFPTVTMEGYAVRTSSFLPGEPVRIIDEVPAGFRASEELVDGTCIKVWPGAPLPPGADAVIPLGVGQLAGEFVVLPAGIAGHGILHRGSYVQAREEVARAGDQLSAELIGSLARCAVRSVRVHPRPRVLAFTMGSQFVEPGIPTPIGLVTDFLSIQTVALAEESGALAFRVPAILDDLVELESVVDDNRHRTDLIVISGVTSAQLPSVAQALSVDLEDAGDFRCAFGEREGTVILVLGADLEELSTWGSSILPAIIGAQRGLSP
jgi:molybdopterin molybdotransferase